MIDEILCNADAEGESMGQAGLKKIKMKSRNVLSWSADLGPKNWWSWLLELGGNDVRIYVEGKQKIDIWCEC